jgi:hypothetical protein
MIDTSHPGMARFLSSLYKRSTISSKTTQDLRTGEHSFATLRQCICDWLTGPSNTLTLRGSMGRFLVKTTLCFASNGSSHRVSSRYLQVDSLLGCETRLMVVQISSPSPAEIPSRNGGNYDPVPYQYFGYPKVAKNAIEMHKPKGLASSEANPIAERVLRPRYLCFLREQGKPAMIIKVEDW